MHLFSANKIPFKLQVLPVDNVVRFEVGQILLIVSVNRNDGTIETQEASMGFRKLSWKDRLFSRKQILEISLW